MPSAAEIYLERIWKQLYGAFGVDGKSAPIITTSPLPVIGKSAFPIVKPVLSIAGAYTANDYVGQSGVPIIFEDCARINGGLGWIQTLKLTDALLQSVNTELWLFNSPVIPPADNAAWTITDAEMEHWVGTITFSTWFASAANSGSQMDQWPMMFKCAAGSKRLYGCTVTRGAPTYISGCLKYMMGIIQD
jgi:hypothetical protein